MLDLIAARISYHDLQTEQIRDRISEILTQLHNMASYEISSLEDPYIANENEARASLERYGIMVELLESFWKLIVHDELSDIGVVADLNRDEMN